jgi:hypothetical protein
LKEKYQGTTTAWGCLERGGCVVWMLIGRMR